jgi:hypothetical protein
LQNHDSAVCPASSFTLSAPSVAGVTASLSSQTVSLSPGASATVTLKIASSATTQNGTYTVKTKAVNSSASTSSASVSATLGVQGQVPPSPKPSPSPVPSPSPSPAQCVRSVPKVVVSPASQNLQRGKSGVYNVAITNLDTAGCSATKMEMGYFIQSAPSAAWSNINGSFVGTVPSSAFTLNPGATVNMKMNVSIPNTSVLGSYVFGAMVHNDNMNGSPFSYGLGTTVVSNNSKNKHHR